MVRTAQGLLLVVAGAIAGAVVFGALFLLVVTLAGTPRIGATANDRAVHFGLSFGLTTGAMLGIGVFDAIAADDRILAKIPPVLVAVLLIGFAAWLLFLGGAWTVIFQYLGNLTGIVLVGWVAVTGLLFKAVPSAK